MTQPAASSSSSLPLVVDALAAELVLLYSQAEQQILTRFATLIETTPTGALLGVLRREALAVVAELRRESSPLAARIARTAAERGDAAALDQLRRIVETSEPVRSLGASSVEQVAARAAVDLQQRLAGTWPPLLRFADDAWRAAGIDEAFGGLTRYTPAMAQRIAWQRLVERGVSGFTDRAGRRWNLATYVEMATRTAVANTFRAASLQRMVAAGIDKFTVPSDGHPCPLCKPWEGRVLTVSGPGPTISEAAAAGLWHPNCRHTLVAYFDGVTQLRPSSWTKEDQARYDATQQLRSLERDVRAHKRVVAASLSVLDRKRAERKVRQIQARIRAHVDEHGLVRRPRREQLDLGN